MSTEQTQTGLVAALGRWDITALVVNTVIGGGIFGLPMIVTGMLGAASPVGYIIAAAGIGVIVLCFAEVSAQFRSAGGPYIYARQAFGPFIGLQVGWITWLMRVSAAGASANLFVGINGPALNATTHQPEDVPDNAIGFSVEDATFKMVHVTTTSGISYTGIEVTVDDGRIKTTFRCPCC